MLTASELVSMPAAGCAAAAVWAWSMPRSAVLRLRVALAPSRPQDGRERQAPTPSRRSPPGRRARHAPGPSDPLRALRAPGTFNVLRAFRALHALWKRRHLVGLRRAAVIELCDGIGSELAAGRTPEAALAASAAALDPEVAVELLGTTAYSTPRSTPTWPNTDHPTEATASPHPDMTTESLSTTAFTTPHTTPRSTPIWPNTDGSVGDPAVIRRLGSGSAPVWSNVDVPALLERAAAQPGAQGLRLLAACWRIGAERGGTFASVVDGLAEALRDEEAQRAEITSQLAGPRTTARLLAGLPVLGLAMAAALGARPVAFLCGTMPGAACLALGLGLDLLGLWWTGRIAAAAERPT